MKTCKQFLALFLALCMMLSVVPVSALATEDATADQPVVQASSEALSGEENTSEEEKASEEVNTSEEEQPSEEGKTSEEEQPSEENKTSEEEKTPEEGTTSEEEKAPEEDTTSEEDKTSEEEKTSEEDQASDDEPLPEEDSVMLLDEDTVQPRDTSSDPFYKILHLDCGRKYFSKDWIVALLYEMQAAGYNQLQLAFGNDGLRFLLNDMSFTANGTTYDHDTVVSKVEAGNSAQNSSGDTRWLTQAEMDEIISIAGKLGIEIVPLLNLPGHANTLLDIFDDAYNADGSYNTFSITNDEGLNCATAIFKKYVDYFAGKGCKFFNFGADEYANDASGSFSFSRLDSAEYQKFVTFINSLATYIESKSMTPRAFNDGLYYNSQTDVSIDTAIQCCYWSSGWGSYPVASATTISGKGHGMINTHGDYYYVLKNGSIQNPLDTALNFSNTTFMGSTISTPVGSMFCIWCDWPTQATEQEVAEDVRITLRQMAAAMSGTTVYSTEVVANGFKEDGSFNSTPSTPAEDKTVWNAEDDSKIISVTGPGLTTVTVEEVTPAYSADGATVVGYDITPYVDETPYSGNATVTIAVPEAVKECSPIKVYDAVNKAFVTSSIADGIITFTAAHFSEYDVVGLADTEIAFDETVTLEIGGTATKTQANVNNSGNVNKDNLNGNIATVEVTGVDAGTATTTYTQVSATCRTLISSDSRNWVAVDGYYYTPDGTNYYPVYAMRSTSSEWSWSSFSYVTTYTYTWGYSTANSASNVTEVGTQSTTSTRDTANIEVYTKATTGTDTPASTTITFTGVAHGTTYVTVGETTYQIVVNYKTKTVNVVVDNTAEVTVSGTADTSKLDTAVAEVAISGNTMTITGKAAGTTTVTVGDTIYTIKVTEEDLTQVAPLTVEFWITNALVDPDNLSVTTDTDTSNKAIRNYYEYPATTTGIPSEDGILFSDLVPASGVKHDDSNAKMVLWKGTRLAEGNEQSIDNGVDKTLAGTDFTYIRYWNGAWAYSSDGKNWTAVAFTGDTQNDQIIAYYLQKTEVTDEVTTQVVDWGLQKGEWSGLAYLRNKYVLMDYSVKYESGEETPSSFPTAKSLAFHCDTGTTNNGVYYRTLGMIRAMETADYEVYLITLTPTSDSTSGELASTAAANTSYTYNGTEVVAWAATDADLAASGLGTYTSISGKYTYSVGGEPIVSGLEIYRQQGMKVTYYVRAKVTEDSLAVHYIDQAANQEFYSYNIAVAEGTLFDEKIALADPWKANLAYGSVKNILGNTQTVSANLSTMPAIGAQYRYSDYTCVEVKRSENGKDVYLYYTFNNTHSFVIDFGLPVHIDAEDVGISGNWTGAEVSGAKYGKASVTVGEGLTYTPDKVLQEAEILQLTLTDSATDEHSTHQIYIYPATTVYYEESFIELTGTWESSGTALAGNQATEVLGSEDHNQFGYDPAYVGQNGASNGTQISTSSTNASGTFDFTGTGVEVYANCTEKTSWLSVEIKDKDSAKTVYLVNTVVKGGDSSMTSGQKGNFYSLPVLSVQGLPSGTYAVTIRKIVDANPVQIDGIRVFDTVARSTFAADKEDCTKFMELRNQVLAGVNVYEIVDEAVVDKTLNDVIKDSQYFKAQSLGILDQVYNESGTTAGAILLSNQKSLTTAQVKDLLDNGPKNELYLWPGQTVTFKLNTDITAQIGMHTVQGNAVSYSVVSNNDNITDRTMNSSTDMFYHTVSGEVTISADANNSGALSITMLKLFGTSEDRPTFAEVEAPQMAAALFRMANYSSAPVDPVDPEPEVPTEPEVVYADASLTVALADYAGNQVASAVLTANGVEGETHSFTAEEILAAAAEQMPETYALVDASAVSGVDVAYGAQQTASVQVGKVATLKVTYISILGRKFGTATITKVQTSAGNCTISASEIRSNAPAGHRGIWFTNAKIPYGTTSSLVVPAI